MVGYRDTQTRNDEIGILSYDRIRWRYYIDAVDWYFADSMRKIKNKYLDVIHLLAINSLSVFSDSIAVNNCDQGCF